MGHVQIQLFGVLSIAGDPPGNRPGLVFTESLGTRSSMSMTGTGVCRCVRAGRGDKRGRRVAEQDIPYLGLPE